MVRVCDLTLALGPYCCGHQQQYHTLVNIHYRYCSFARAGKNDCELNIMLGDATWPGKSLHDAVLTPKRCLAEPKSFRSGMCIDDKVECCLYSCSHAQSQVLIVQQWHRHIRTCQANFPGMRTRLARLTPAKLGPMGRRLQRFVMSC